MSVSPLCAPLRKPPFPVDWRLLIEERIDYICIPLHIFEKHLSISKIFWVLNFRVLFFANQNCWTHGIDLDSWYWQGLMVYTWTRGIYLDSWYTWTLTFCQFWTFALWCWLGLMVYTLTHGIDNNSWYWYRILVLYRYSWIINVQEGWVLPICRIFLSFSWISWFSLVFLGWSIIF